MTKVYLVGSCGSIGFQTIDILSKNKDKFEVIGISVGHDLVKAKKAIDLTNPKIVCFRHKEDIGKFKDYTFLKL